MILSRIVYVALLRGRESNTLVFIAILVRRRLLKHAIARDNSERDNPSNVMYIISVLAPRGRK